MDSRPKRQSKKSTKLLDYELDLESSGKKKSAKMESGKPSIPKLTIKFDKEESDSSKQFVAMATKVKGKPGRKRKKSLGTDVTATKKAKVEPSLPPDDEDYIPAIDASFDAEEESDVDASNSTSKRQRKLPAKFTDDYAVESDLLANKAAKFFETKKAEQKAANALAKQEAAAKSDKKKRNRVPNGYTMWCNSYRAKLQAQCPGMSFGALNKKLGEVWSSIPLKEKNQWNRRAKRLIMQGTPKNVDSLKFLGSKGIASLVRNKCLQETSSTPKSMSCTKTESFSSTNLNPVYKVTETEPADVAAYLGVMAETMSAVGTGLSNTMDKQVHGSMSLLLDSLLCSMSSLVCLTQQVPELDEGIDPQSHKQRMADVSHFLPRIS